MSVSLRPYQVEAVDRLRASMRRHRRVCFQLPTGGGKTIIFGYIAQGVCARGRCVLILVHRRELIRQTLEKLAFFGIEARVIAAGWPADSDQAIQVASVQTLARRLEQAPDADLVIVDECHHAVAATWAAVLERYQDKRVLGVTATPERLDGKGLAQWFDDLVYGPSVRELIDAGFLADLDVLSHPAPDLSGIKKIAGDYAVGELAERMSEQRLLGNAVAHYRDHASGRPAITFCVTVAHAELVAARFRAAGYRAATVDGSMPPRERDSIINGLASGELQIVTSCALISEGLDIPDVGAAVLLRPTASLAMYLQQVGRALRPKPDGSRAIVLDHAGNAMRHGHPVERRLWSLEGRPAREAAEQAEREREEQLARNPVEPGAQELDGQLVPLTSGEFERSYLRHMPLRNALALCVTEADVRQLGRVRGYKPGWAWHVLREHAARAAA
jgi:DNA repair protein RadD